MIIPELIHEESGAYKLIANHCLSNQEAVDMSVAFNKARVVHAQKHLPENLNKCTLFYDTRGQFVSDKKIAKIRNEFNHIHDIQFLTN